MTATLALPTTGPSPLAARIAISAVFFFNGMGFASWVTRNPAVRHALGLSEGQQVGVTVVAFAITGLGIATVAPLVFGAAARRSTASAGQGIAAMAAMGYSGFLVGPALIGFVAQATSLRLALGLLAAMAALIAVLAFHLRGEPAAAA